MKLDLYHKKRNFRKTPEPKGKVVRTNKHLYIIQKHAASHLHYDFRLELQGVLLSWAVPKGPCLDPAVKRLAMHVEDHPVEYGSFEGIIPQGEYGGGIVMLWDEGIWLPEDDDPVAAYHKGHLRFQLKAKKLNGRWSLIRFKKEEKSWFLVKTKDKFAKPIAEYDITLKKPNSVVSNASLEEIADNYKKVWSQRGLINATQHKKTSKKKVKNYSEIKIDLPKTKMPIQISPQLATLVDEAPSGHDWLHEIKFDGYRILAFKNGQKVKLISRNQKNWTQQFTEIANAIKQCINKNVILDGELVVLDEAQRSNFQLLQNAVGTTKHPPFLYYIFDIIYYDQYNLKSLSLIERKNILQQLLAQNKNITLRYSDHIIGDGVQVFKKSCAMALEGIVSKNVNSTYLEKRTKNWLKVKCIQRQEFVIGGFSLPKGSRNYFGSLFIGYFDKNNELIYAGNVGTGFNQTSLKNIFSKLKKNIIPINPFKTKPPGATTAQWVKPEMVIEIEFTEYTKDGRLRHPSFKGLRVDKPANKVIKEKPEKTASIVKTTRLKNISKKIDLPIDISNPKKILYPEDKITKLELAEYYDKIQQWILPYVVNRPLTLVRCPDTYKKCFYQKHINSTTPKELHGVKIKEKNTTEQYIYIKDRAGLLALAQMGVLELHPWGSRIEQVENPDMITFDLDPDVNISWGKVVDTAKRIRKHLKALKLECFVKTTGGKGLHIVVPILPKYSWDEVKRFSQVFVEFLVKTYPNEYVSNMAKNKRKGKIFVDYLRNARGATAVAAYSTRARAEAPIATPVDWKELTKNRADTFYTLKTLPKRLTKLKKDPWEKFFKLKQKLVF